jgi:TonB-linked SusC/RagA family outer membrane protein
MIQKTSLLYLALGISSVLSAQNRQTIRGTVTDAKNETIIGATVTAAGSAAITDLVGHFELSVDEGVSLTVSYIGYVNYEEQVVASKSFYRIVLQEDVKQLDDVVVVGYGTQRRSELTGAISSVRAEDIKDFSSKSLAESLTGLAAGVMVTKGDGSPGGSADIIIRGAGSLNGMSPLYVVDGVPQEAGFTFNMRDVASIEILKDAGSAAIYGSRAAGGVILITTQRATGEKATLQANARYGIRNILHPIRLLNTADWIRARDAFETGSTLDVLGAKTLADLPDTDWMNVMFDTGLEQEYNLSLAASSGKTRFYLSGSYLNEKGVYRDTDAHRFSFRNNLDYEFSRHITLGESISGSTRKTNPATTSSIYNHTIPFRTVPVAPLYDDDGHFAPTPSAVGSGPNFAGLEEVFHVFNDNNYALHA